MAHTPGPWTHDEGEPHLVAGDPETMFDCYYIFDADGNCIAIIPDDPYLGLSVLDNIRLIDASPDLLTACKTALPLLERFFEELKVAEMDEVGRCPACSCYDEYCSNHKLQHDLLNVIPSIIRDIAKAEGTPPACSSCGSVFQDGDPQQTGDDGPLCLDCYGRLRGERDRADERYRLGDIQFDQSRGN